MPGELQELKVERPRRHGSAMPETGRVAKVSSRSTDFVYVNSAYVASVHDTSVRIQTEETQRTIVTTALPPTSVIREQYWACSKWSTAQRVLAVSVGVLFGIVVVLAVLLILDYVEKKFLEYLMTPPTAK